MHWFTNRCILILGCVEMAKKLIRLIIGLFLCSVGIVMSVKANLGVAPWDVLHTGLTAITDFTLGQVSIGVGLIIIVVDYLLDVKIGIGTVLNMILIGVFIDIIMFFDLITIPDTMFISIVMIIGSLFFISIGSFLYIGAGLGTGPRDGLMVGITKKTQRRIGTIRGLIEVTALIIGYILGGKVGFGTVLLALGIGFVVQMTFNFFNFEAEKVEHIYFIN
jgi:uncharacterized membrane protein YczE